MKTLEQIKDEVAKENGLGKLVTGHLVKYFDQVAKRYAQQVAEDVRRRCAENATIDYAGYEEPYSPYVDQNSILNTEIILP